MVGLLRFIIYTYIDIYQIVTFTRLGVTFSHFNLLSRTGSATKSWVCAWSVSGLVSCSTDSGAGWPVRPGQPASGLEILHTLFCPIIRQSSCCWLYCEGWCCHNDDYQQSDDRETPTNHHHLLLPLLLVLSINYVCKYCLGFTTAFKLQREKNIDKVWFNRL